MRMQLSRPPSFLIKALAFLLSTPAAAADYKASPLKEAPPGKHLSKGIKSALSTEGLRVVGKGGKPYADVWLRKSIETVPDKESALGVKFGHVPDGALLGLIRFHHRGSDFRGDRIRPGVYTFRRAIHPEDGDHQGVSDTRDFVLLCRPEEDTKLAPLPQKEVIELSKKASKRGHPAILYLMKMYDKPKKLPRLVEYEDWQYWILDCKIKNAKKDGKPVRLGLVLVGETEQL